MNEDRVCNFCNRKVAHKDSVAQNMRTAAGGTKWGYAHAYCMEQSVFEIPRVVLHLIIEIGSKIPRRK